MKPIKPFVKVAGILFLMYLHLALIAAIGFRLNHGQQAGINARPGSVFSQDAGEGVSKNNVSGRVHQPEEFVVPSAEPEPESSIENWMLDPDYLDMEAEQPAPIESWMLDTDYLNN